MPPNYPDINPTVLKTLLARLFGRKRSFHDDSVRLCGQVRPAILYEGLGNLPAERPLLITANHFHRKGFNTAWIALAISAVFSGEVHWILSNEWLFEGNPLAFLLRPLMRFVLKSITLAYDFSPMPTMTPGHSTPQGRSAGVRGVIERLRLHPDSILGLTPEGMDSQDGHLRLPPTGVGRFVLHLQQMGVTLLPAAVYEANGALYVSFGRPWKLNPPDGLSKAELDLWARQEVMRPIQALLNGGQADRG